LQRVDATCKGVGERVGGREGGEVGEHDFLHADGVDDGLEEDALVFNLCTDEDEEAGEDDPGAMQRDATDHGGESDELAEPTGGAFGRTRAMLLREGAAHESSGVERVGGQQMEYAEAGLEPDGAAEKPLGADEGLFEEADVSARAEEGGGESQSGEQVGEGAGGGEKDLAGAVAGAILAFRIGVGEHAANGQQKDSAEAEVEGRGDEEASGFSYGDGENEREKERKATRGSDRGRKHEADGDEQQKEGVDAQFDTNPAAKRNGPASHRGIVEGRGRNAARVVFFGAMRVIAGEFRSRVLEAPAGMDTRPTSDRLRETLFNVLAPRIEGAAFLDLYAGSGAVGIEALSRGAAAAEFVERADGALKALRGNLIKLGLKAAIHKSGVAAYLRRAGGKRFDVVFLDPPYEARSEYEAALGMLGGAARALVAENGMVIAEHRRKEKLEERYGVLKRTRLLEQGDAALSFYSIGVGEDEAGN
jgi:16S rRNA (guanine966-N2)-methyltransferase